MGKRPIPTIRQFVKELAKTINTAVSATSGVFTLGRICIIGQKRRLGRGVFQGPFQATLTHIQVWRAGYKPAEGHTLGRYSTISKGCKSRLTRGGEGENI